MLSRNKTVMSGLVNMVLNAARNCVKVGKQTFDVGGIRFEIVSVTMSEFCVMQNGKDAGVRVYRNGDKVVAEVA